MPITAKELAKMLNLSEAAVSIALNNKPGVSTKTRKRVIQEAHNHGYDFSKIIRSASPVTPIWFILYKKHGAVVADTPFFSELSQGIEETIRKTNYKINICHLYEGKDVKVQLEHILSTGCAGIILLGTEMKAEDFKLFEDIKVPIVLLDTYHSSPKLDCVLINNMEGALQATNYLIREHKVQPGYLHSSYSINNFEERADGFYKALRQNGMAPSRSIIHLLSPSVEGAYADMIQIIEQGETLASAYFADNDLIAAGAIKAFKEKGYAIPDMVQIIGFDNMPICNYIEPPLSTIHVPKIYMGKIAAERLIDTLQKKEHNSIKIEISTTLIERGSV